MSETAEEPAADERADKTFQHDAPDAATTQNPAEPESDAFASEPDE